VVEWKKVGSRRLSTPLLVSAAVHAALLAWIADEMDLPRRILGDSDRSFELTEVELVPADLAILHTPQLEPEPQPQLEPEPQPESEPVPEPEPELVPTPATVPSGTRAGHGEHMSATTGATSTGSATTTEPGARPTPGGDQHPGVTPPTPRETAGAIEPLLGPPPPPSPLAPPRRRKPARVRSEIVPDGKGAYRGEESVFVARVDRDGSVHFEDKPNFHIHLALPSARDLGEGLESWYADPYGRATADERAIETHTVTIVGGGFDLTDWAMRHAGQDPYSYRKAAFLERTRDERAQMSATEERENIRDSLAALPEFLGRVWDYTPWSKAKRRQVLFELWDECAEEGSPAVLQASKTARATIVAFIRRELPDGHADAYTTEELRTLNATRKSEIPFEPYD